MNSSTDWADAGSFGLADSVIVFASIALAIEFVWIVLTETRPIQDVFVRRLILLIYVMCILLTTILFGVLAAKYDITTHLTSTSCPVGINACNMMGITLGMSIGVWAGLIVFLVYATQRPHAFVLSVSQPEVSKRKSKSRR